MEATTYSLVGKSINILGYPKPLKVLYYSLSTDTYILGYIVLITFTLFDFIWYIHKPFTHRTLTVCGSFIRQIFVDAEKAGKSIVAK